MSTGTPRTTTFTLPRLELIRQALTELGRTPQPFGYAVGKNLRIVSRILDAAQEIGRDFMKTMSESNSIPIVVRKGGADGPIIRPYVTGEPLAADEGAYYDMNPEQRDVVNAFDATMNSEPHTVQWHTIAESALENASDLPGNVLPILYDAGIIIETPQPTED